MQSPELQSQLNDWRQRSVDGTLTIDEMRKAIILMRAGRTQAMTAASASKSKKPPARSAEDMLNELDNL